MNAPARGCVRFGTKAETLERLRPVLRGARILPLLTFSAAEWHSDRGAVLAQVAAAGWQDTALIVRSCARDEDGAGGTRAGRYLTVPQVRGGEALAQAIDRVFASYGNDDPREAVFLQPMLQDIALGGVAFSRDPSTGGPYFVVSYDDSSGRTDRVTSGTSNDIRTAYVYRQRPEAAPAPLAGVLALLRELERALDCDTLDIEFACTRSGELHLLQARRLQCTADAAVPANEHAAALERIHASLRARMQPHPYLHGARTVFGVMPDWNPAEIVGVRPRPLALSLYRELVTDSIWAYQRDHYGYRNLRSFPLLLSFAGLPYIDVRVSFNSFIPSDVPAELAERLAGHYLERLLATPSHHDKVEFEIILSCYSFDLPQRLAALAAHGFGAAERAALAGSLRRLTNAVIHGKRGLWRDEIGRIRELESRRATILAADLDPVARIYWLLEDCKRYGTLPFAGLARAGFIAVQLLRSMVATGILDAEAYGAFMASLDTVGSRMTRDFAALGREDFLARYGHLRPGTYDILAPRYDEQPERYFDWNAPRAAPARPPAAPFALSAQQESRCAAQLAAHGLETSVAELFHFLKAAIEGREYSKFVFTRSLSDALSLIKRVGADCGLDAEDCSYADIGFIRQAYISTEDPAQALADSIARGRREHALTRSICLPSLITSAQDVWSFHLPAAEPNYVTLGRASGPVASASERDLERLQGAILMIPSADPGYDWIFARGIAGFITMYGGANSHMAIRAVGLGIPAVVGAGEALYAAWARAGALEIDAAGRLVRILR